MTQAQHNLMTDFLSAVMAERHRQIEKHGSYPVPIPDGVTRNLFPVLRDVKELTDLKLSTKTVTWVDILAEEFLEAITEEDEPILGLNIGSEEDWPQEQDEGETD